MFFNAGYMDIGLHKFHFSVVCASVIASDVQTGF